MENKTTKIKQILNTRQLKSKIENIFNDMRDLTYLWKSSMVIREILNIFNAKPNIWYLLKFCKTVKKQSGLQDNY